MCAVNCKLAIFKILRLWQREGKLEQIFVIIFAVRFNTLAYVNMISFKYLEVNDNTHTKKIITMINNISRIYIVSEL